VWPLPLAESMGGKIIFKVKKKIDFLHPTNFKIIEPPPKKKII
jgi:hypothetical protein